MQTDMPDWLRALVEAMDRGPDAEPYPHKPIEVEEWKVLVQQGKVKLVEPN
jgi:hypothetical protein